MIDAKKGIVIAKGSIPELLADLTTAMECIYQKALLPMMPKESALDCIQKVVENATNESKEEAKPEKEEKIDRIENLLRDLLSEVLEAGDDE